MTDDLRAPAETAVRQCLAVQPDESFLVITDDERLAIGEALYDAAAAVTDDPALLRYPPGDQHGEEPPAAVAAAMQEVDAFLAPTTTSISHTRARSEATEAGARGATLPEITEAVFRTGLDADYDAIRTTCAEVYDRVAGAEEVRITSPQGTDLTVRPGDREWLQDTGIVHSDGEFSNLPAGEVFVAPETADGTWVVDGTMKPHDLLGPDQRLEFEVTDGQVTHIGDDAVRQQVEAAASEAGDAAYNFAELGIGTNLGVTELVGHVLLDEKAAGTVHVAIGDDAGIGGDTDAPLHMDGVMREPTVAVDGEEIELPSGV